MSTEFSNAITEVEKYLMKNAERYRKMFEPGGELEYNNLISDMMGCITDNSIVGGAFMLRNILAFRDTQNWRYLPISSLRCIRG